VQLSLQLVGLRDRGYLKAQHQHLDQHDNGERDDNVGSDEPTR
jgi:hypothetical protein